MNPPKYQNPNQLCVFVDLELNAEIVGACNQSLISRLLMFISESLIMENNDLAWYLLRTVCQCFSLLSCTSARVYDLYENQTKSLIKGKMRALISYSVEGRYYPKDQNEVSLDLFLPNICKKGKISGRFAMIPCLLSDLSGMNIPGDLHLVINPNVSSLEREIQSSISKSHHFFFKYSVQDLILSHESSGMISPTSSINNVDINPITRGLFNPTAPSFVEEEPSTSKDTEDSQEINKKNQKKSKLEKFADNLLGSKKTEE